MLTWLPEVGLGGGEDLAPGRHVVAGEGGRPGSGSGCDRLNWGRGVSPSPRSCCVRVSAHCLSWRKGKLGGQKCRGPGQESLEGSVRSGGRVDRGPRRRRAGEAVGHQRAGSPGCRKLRVCDVRVTLLSAAHPDEGSGLQASSALLPGHSSAGRSCRERRVPEPWFRVDVSTLIVTMAITFVPGGIAVASWLSARD